MERYIIVSVFVLFVIIIIGCAIVSEARERKRKRDRLNDPNIPNEGDFRIVTIARVDGPPVYRVQMYDWGAWNSQHVYFEREGCRFNAANDYAKYEDALEFYNRALGLVPVVYVNEDPDIHPKEILGAMKEIN